MNEHKCKYCGKNAISHNRLIDVNHYPNGNEKKICYNTLIDICYCPDCSQLAHEEWIELIDKIVNYARQHKEEADG